MNWVGGRERINELKEKERLWMNWEKERANEWREREIWWWMNEWTELKERMNEVKERANEWIEESKR